ncbi:MAG TPA: hypothetical protein VEH86_03970 [Candidatus Acidoferrum sp.]|nr:hypothetical protein [Candidatus Acidoferrum sp.]
MKGSTVLSLATVLFKSYFRASRLGRRSFFSNPRVLIAIDLILFAIPFGLMAYALPLVPTQYRSDIQPVAVQALVVVPVLLTAAVIVAGVLFELGQSSGLASSEAVNWLPVSPNEYILASSISTTFTYSPLFFLCLGFTIPLASNFGMLSAVPLFVGISFVAFIWGAVIVEALRSVMNRISSSVYKKSGKAGVVLRVLLVVILLVAVQSAFNPYVLYLALSGIVSGISLAWFVPMIWPSVAVASFLAPDAFRATVFTLLSFLFTLLIFEGTSKLRAKYWSPMPVSIAVSTSTVYVPQGRSLLWLDPVAFAIASKELRALSRRREMTRYLAVPVMLVVASLIPVLTSSSNKINLSEGVGLLLLAEASLILPMMLSSISIGQEGKSISNIYMLPISAEEMVNGKLFLSWLISSIGVLGIGLLMQFLAPVTILQLLTVLIVGLFNIPVQGYVGLGAGSRYPNFTIGPRARYITFTGFLISFVTGLLITLGIFAPLIMHDAGFLNGLNLGSAGSALLEIALTAAIGTALLIAARTYCLQGVKKLLSNMEA